MTKSKNSGFNLATKTTAVFAAALATLTGLEANKAISKTNINEDSNHNAVAKSG
jgi:hypothetical protein